jgi:hypothetical protein
MYAKNAKYKRWGVSEQDMDTPTWCHGCPPHVVREQDCKHDDDPMIRICLDDTRSDVQTKN